MARRKARLCVFWNDAEGCTQALLIDADQRSTLIASDVDEETVEALGSEYPELDLDIRHGAFRGSRVKGDD